MQHCDTQDYTMKLKIKFVCKSNYKNNINLIIINYFSLIKVAE